jgi:hypothetical protein
MATATPPRSTPAAKSEAFVERQLTRARQRIRLLDLTAAALGLAVLDLLYAVGMILLDGRLELPSRVRQLAFLGFAAVAAVYLGVAFVWPLCRRINPYYAARQVEQTLPGAKNSVVNWLDLHDEPLPPAIHTAVAQRAAKDLADADLEEAINGRRTAWLGGLAGVLLLALFAQFVAGGRQFLSLFGRAFAPFVEASIKTRTQLTLLQPERGDLTVPVGRAVSFAVRVNGRTPAPDQPDAIKLLYRYHASDPYEEQRLERGDGPGEWVTLVPAFQVHNGFWYKVSGGDAETPEYRVGVRATPLLTDFEVHYHFRPYLGWPDQATREPNLKAMRGTAVTLLARANRTVRSAQLTLDAAKKAFDAELVPGEPQAMRFRFVLDQDDTYRIWFVSDEGERNTEPMPYEIRVLRDKPPQVTLTKPGQDSSLPVNGVLQVQGSATDDFGVTGLKLRMQVSDKGPLPDKPYRGGKPLRQADNTWPQKLDYADFVELDKVKQADGQPLKPGLVIDYWLEAADNCDYPPPGPNIGRSQRYKLTLTEPQKDEQKQEQKKQAEQERQKQQQQQDRDLQQPKQPNQGENQQQTKDQPEQPPESPPDKELKEQRDRLNKAIEQQEKEKKQEQGDKSNKQDQEKGDKSQPQNKDGQGNRGENQPSPDKPPDKDKQTGKQPQKNQGGNGSGQSEPKPDKKDQGNQGANQPQPGGDKTAGQQNKPDGRQGEKQPNEKQPQQGSDPQKQPGAENGNGPPQKQPGTPNNAGQKEGKPEGGPKGQEGSQQQKQSDGQKSGTGSEPKKDQGTGPQSGPQNPKAGSGSADKPRDGSAGAAPESQPNSPDKGNGTKPENGNGGDKSGKPEGSGKPNASPDAKDGGKPEQPAGAGQQPLKKDGPKDGKSGAGKGETGPKADANSKPAAGKRKKPEKSNGDGKGDNSSKELSDPRIKDLIDRAKGGDPQARKEAADRLSKLRDQVKDPRDREAIDRALKGAGERTAKQPDARQDERDASGGNRRQEPRTGTGRPAEAGPTSGRTKADRPPDPKAGESSGKPGEPSAISKQGKPGDPSGQQGQPGQEQAGGSKDGSERRQPSPSPAKPGDAPGNGTAGSRQGESAGNPNGGAEETGAAADPRYQKKAGDLQLEDFKKKVTKDVLQKANMTEAEYQKFLKAYEEALKRQKQAPLAKAEPLPDPKRRGGGLKNQAAHRVQGVPAKDATQSAGPGTAPPEYLEKYRDFTEKLSNLERRKKNN